MHDSSERRVIVSKRGVEKNRPELLNDESANDGLRWEAYRVAPVVFYRGRAGRGAANARELRIIR